MLVNSSEIVLVKNLNVEHFINIVKLDVRKTKKRFKNRIANCVYSKIKQEKKFKLKQEIDRMLGKRSKYNIFISWRYMNYQQTSVVSCIFRSININAILER